MNKQIAKPKGVQPESLDEMVRLLKEVTVLEAVDKARTLGDSLLVGLLLA